MRPKFITKEDDQMLKDMAERLPKIEVKTKDGKGVPNMIRMHGSTLLAQGQKKLSTGHDIRPDFFYLMEVGKVCIDHHKQLRLAYLRGGAKECSLYVDKIRREAVVS